jgi:hypothetical protein
MDLCLHVVKHNSMLHACYLEVFNTLVFDWQYKGGKGLNLVKQMQWYINMLSSCYTYMQLIFEYDDIYFRSA